MRPRGYAVARRALAFDEMASILWTGIMNVLAFDTCLGAVSAAVRWRGPDGWLQREAYKRLSSGHAERLFPMIVEVMDGAGLQFSTLDRIAVTVGPGGFTAVRIGISAARALALATGRPVVATTSLAVMAHRAMEMLGETLEGRQLTVAVDAGRGAHYVQSFSAGATATGEPLLLTSEEAGRSVGRQGAIVVGTGAIAVADLAKEAGRDAEPRFPDLQPHALSLALLAPRLVPVHPVRPLYLRQADARPQDAASAAPTPS
jgi:tRNA threonylcarbamoyl adenosine modification protein YeaZ